MISLTNLEGIPSPITFLIKDSEAQSGIGQEVGNEETINNS